MTGFLTPLKLEIDRTQGWRGVRLIGPLVYRFDGGRIVVQPGFHSVLASIPATLRWIVGKLEPHASAAVLHDYLYATALMPREAADRLFLEAMTNSGVGRIKRRAMFAAVRLFGRFYWN